MFEATVAKAVVLRGGRNIADLDVGRVWKGELGRHSRLFYDADTIESVQLKVGKRYVIFAPWFAFLDFTDGRRVAVDVERAGCGWAIPYEEVEAELPDLGRSKRAR